MAESAQNIVFTSDISMCDTITGWWELNGLTYDAITPVETTTECCTCTDFANITMINHSVGRGNYYCYECLPDCIAAVGRLIVRDRSAEKIECWDADLGGFIIDATLYTGVMPGNPDGHSCSQCNAPNGPGAVRLVGAKQVSVYCSDCIDEHPGLTVVRDKFESRGP